MDKSLLYEFLGIPEDPAMNAIIERSIPVQRHPEIRDGCTLNFLAICHDQTIDRRILQQVDALMSEGLSGLIIALSKSNSDEFSSITLPHGQVPIHAIGLLRIVPDCPVYWKYQKRQAVIKKKYFAPELSKLSKLYYKFQLYLKYRYSTISYPLPFDLAFFSSGLLYNNVKLIFAHDLTTLKSAVVLGEIHNIPIIYDSHELYSEQKVFSKHQKKILEAREKKYIHRCQRVLTVSHACSRRIAEKNQLESRPNVILNVADYPNSDYDSDHYSDPSLRKIVRAQDGEKIILYQGGLLRHRNLDNLLDGFIRLARPDVYLVFLGPAEANILASLRKKALKSVLNHRIYFLDPVSQDILLKITQTADFGVIPYYPVDENSKYCLPNKLFEYIQANIPILANNQLPEVSHLMHQLGGGGMLAKLQKPKDFAKAFELMLTRNLTQDRMILKRHAKQFSWSSHEKTKFLQIVQEFL